MRKTKIICTLGPSTDSPEILQAMMENGMDVARFNFSHGSHDEHKRRLEELKALRKKLNLPVAALLDTKGPEIRLRTFEEGKVTLEAGQHFTLTAREVIGTQEICSVSYKNLAQDVHVGSQIMLDDGLISMKVVERTETDVLCLVENGGLVKDRKGVNVPGVHLSMPYMSAQDRADILFGIQEGFDFIAASFCRTAQDVMEIRRLLDEHHSDIRIIAKLENQEGVNNVDEILAVADGVMIARGDMGVEIDFTEIPVIQKDIIAYTLGYGKHVITATQMLDSMITNPRPTRAEITDVANAVYDGTSAIMLSGETAAGRYPVEAVQTMDAIARKTESHTDDARLLGLRCRNRMNITAATAHAACTTAKDIGADAILTVSQAGITAQMVSSFRPETTVVALLLEEQVQRQMALYWGVEPITMPRAENTDELVELAVQSAEKAGLIRHGDLVVITAGVPVGISGTTNMIRIQQVGGSLLNAVGVGGRTASGPLCVCRSVEEVAEKFHAGDVLVVPYTTNELLPYLRDAAAIICEEGSTECHAATVGLLLSKPVLVGAGDATRRLEDGVRVSVDCARGVVQTMPQ